MTFRALRRLGGTGVGGQKIAGARGRPGKLRVRLRLAVGDVEEVNIGAAAACLSPLRDHRYSAGLLIENRCRHQWIGLAGATENQDHGGESRKQVADEGGSHCSHALTLAIDRYPRRSPLES